MPSSNVRLHDSMCWGILSLGCASKHRLCVFCSQMFQPDIDEPQSHDEHRPGSTIHQQHQPGSNQSKGRRPTYVDPPAPRERQVAHTTAHNYDHAGDRIYMSMLSDADKRARIQARHEGERVVDPAAERGMDTWDPAAGMAGVVQTAVAARNAVTTLAKAKVARLANAYTKSFLRLRALKEAEAKAETKSARKPVAAPFLASAPQKNIWQSIANSVGLECKLKEKGEFDEGGGTEGGVTLGRAKCW